MEIDKRLGGNWSLQENELDDLSYYLYVKKHRNNGFLFDQYLFTWTYKANMGHSKYYNDALLILRKEKIRKLINKIYENKKRICK